ncbi:MAG: pre-peptidase C-terminal domain-containing protein [Myxococcota bacterium]|nr:pre-peptidase C-terminal domain-containing protein [Myxococcota bacterium]
MSSHVAWIAVAAWVAGGRAQALAQPAAGETRVFAGSLGPCDTVLDGGRFADVVTVRGSRGQRLVLWLVSTEFDPYLAVQAPSGRRFEDDDGGKARNARLAVELPEDGEYRIGLTSAAPGETGEYRLEMRLGAGRLSTVPGAGPRVAPGLGAIPVEVGAPRIEAGVRPVGRGGPVLRPAPGAVPVDPGVAFQTQFQPFPIDPGPTVQPGVPVRPRGAPLAHGRSTAGTLEPGDETLGTGQWVDWYEFESPGGVRVMLDLLSREFDSFLVAVSPSGAAIENDDVSPGNTDSRLMMVAAEAGTYLVGASSYRRGERGSYSMRLVVEGAGTGVAAQAAAPGRRIEGSLVDGDERLPDGEWIDWYSFRGEAGQAATIDLASSEFDPYLVLVAPGGEQVDNDDISEADRNSRISRTLDATGDYQVGVTSYQPGERGRYELRMDVRAGASQPGPVEAAAGRIAAGTSRSGRLEHGDSRLGTGEFVDGYSFEGASGQAVRIDLQSSEFDSYLILRFPSGRQIENDDASPTGRNSLIETTLEEGGTYRVLVTSYRPGEMGSYDLALSAGDGAAATAAGETGPVPDQHRRFYGVFVGITDYPPGVGDLAYCREDAEKLGRAFRQVGLMDGAQMDVLVDGRARKADVRSAMRRMASRVGPNDVFVFFYSGHGDQTDRDARAHADEVDGRGESIVLGRDHYTDDEMAEDLDGIRAGLTVVVIDACFSGGFARDVISRPDRVGFFSSEEDLTSNVAVEFQAGGYLSLFFRQAIEGRADLDGDGVVRIGELSHYIRDQYAQHVRAASAETTEGAAGYQHLVVDRGSVRVDTVFYRSGTGTAPRPAVRLTGVSPQP